MYRILIMLAILGLLLLLFAVGAYWSDMPDKEQQAKEKAAPKSDYERKCRYIFSDNAEWGYILQGQKK